MPYKRGKQMHEGGEGRIYEIDYGKNPSRFAAKEFYVNRVEQTSECMVKARFYLTKIMQLLYPEHVVDIHGSYSKPNSIVMDNVDFGDAHKRMNEDSVGDIRLSGKERMLIQRYLEDIRDKSGIVKKVRDVGVMIDDKWTNFGKDPQGNIKYTDTIHAWRKFADSGLLQLFIPDELYRAIEEKLSDAPQKKEQALIYLCRLMDLFLEELQEFSQ